MALAAALPVAPQRTTAWAVHGLCMEPLRLQRALPHPSALRSVRPVPQAQHAGVLVLGVPGLQRFKSFASINRILKSNNTKHTNPLPVCVPAGGGTYGRGPNQDRSGKWGAKPQEPAAPVNDVRAWSFRGLGILQFLYVCV